MEYYSFHTIKSISNAAEEILALGEDVCFHTIKSISNPYTATIGQQHTQVSILLSLFQTFDSHQIQSTKKKQVSILLSLFQTGG